MPRPVHRGRIRHDASLPKFVKDEFDALLECGILAHGFLPLHCGECGHDKLVAFSCKCRGFRPRTSTDSAFTPPPPGYKLRTVGVADAARGQAMQGPIHSVAWDALAARVGTELGVSDWITITQPMIDAFADLTGDHFFLHVDAPRAAALPFKGTIAHGFLTLSLVATMSYQVCPGIAGARYPLNYGFNRLRFVEPVPVGSRVRGRFVLRRAEEIGAGQRQTVYDVTVEIEGASRPALVAEWLWRALI